MQDRHFIALGSFNMLIAIALGAFGAHALKPLLGADLLAVWQTAVQYHLVHGLALIALGLLLPRFEHKRMCWAGIAFFVGIVLFSGSLYALALSNLKILGAITPLGGLAFLAGWGILAWSALRHK